MPLGINPFIKKFFPYLINICVWLITFLTIKLLNFKKLEISSSNDRQRLPSFQSLAKKTLILE